MTSIEVMIGAPMVVDIDASRLERVNRAIEAQKRFIRTVPDPDNRERAEANLMSLVLKRDEYVDAQEAFLNQVLIK